MITIVAQSVTVHTDARRRRATPVVMCFVNDSLPMTCTADVQRSVRSDI